MMRRRLFAWALLIGGLLFSHMGVGVARADLGGWSIAEFDARIEIQPNGGLKVTETIAAEFTEPRRGIYREIPVRYDIGMHLYDLRFRLLGVDDGQGNAYPTKVSYESNKVSIRIGDPDVTVTGRQVYRIRYGVDRVIQREGEHNVLRWNATGTEWRVPIARAEVTVLLPEDLNDGDVSYTGWTGVYGSRQQDFTDSRPDPRTIHFETTGLRPQQGISVEVVMPAGAIERATFLRRLGWWVGDNFIYGLIPATLAICASLWYSRGRDAPGRGTIVVEYQPPDDLRPAEVGTLIDETVDMQDISATIIDLAVRRYLNINESKKDGWFSESVEYTFEKRKDGGDLRPFERALFNKLFESGSSVKLTDLKETYYTAIPKAKKTLYASLSTRQYFDGNPDTVRTTFLLLGILAVGAAGGLAALIQYAWVGRVFPAPLVLSVVVGIITVIVTSRYMSRKTRKGRIAWEQIRGLEEYIRRAEIDDLKAQERQGIFESLLPYAIAFGLADRWASAFEGLYTQPPEWYRTSDRNAFTTAYLASSLNNSVHRMNTVLPSQPRSSSSGGGGGWSSGGGSFSGGGFGGGGGGSW